MTNLLFKYKLNKKWSADPKIGSVSFPPYFAFQKYSRLQDSLISKMVDLILKTQFSISRVDKKAGFIEVSTVMQDEMLTKTYCEKIVKAAVDRYVALKTQRQKLTVEKLQSRVDSVANLLSLKTQTSASLQTKATTMDINPLYRTGAAIATETTMRDKTMLATIFASVTQNLEMAKFTLSQETPAIQIVDTPILPLNKTKSSRILTAISFAFLFCSIFAVILTFRERKGGLYNI